MPISIFVCVCLSLLQKCKAEFSSIAELIEHYTVVQDELPCLLSCARVNHCYEWEENIGKHVAKKPQKNPAKAIIKSTHKMQWV